MPRNYSQSTLKALFALSGNRCACPECEFPAVEHTSDGKICVVGEVAHIVAVGNNGPRAREDFAVFDKNDLSNLIVLCPIHHTIVDKLPHLYREDLLKSWKARRENRQDKEDSSLFISQSIAVLIVDLLRISYVLSDRVAFQINGSRLPKFISMAEHHLVELKDEIHRASRQYDSSSTHQMKEIERCCQGVLSHLKTREDLAFSLAVCFRALRDVSGLAFAFFRASIKRTLTDNELLVAKAFEHASISQLSPIWQQRLAIQQNLIDLTQSTIGVPSIAHDVSHALSIAYFLIDHRLFSELPGNF